MALLNIPCGTEFFLTEFKIRDKKDVSRLANIFDTDVGIITELKSSYGDAANVNVLAGLKAGGEIAFCAEDDVLSLLCEKDVATDSVSVNGGVATLHAENICQNDGYAVFDIVGDNVAINGVKIPLFAEDDIKSALFAALIGIKLGISNEKIRTGLENCHSPELGVKVFTERGVTFIVDTSSATTDSVKSGIDFLCEIANRRGGGKKIALVGDIRDFSQDTRAHHEKMGEYIFENKIDKLFTYGIAAEQICVGARRAGMSEKDCVGNLDLFSPVSSAQAIESVLKEGDVLLIRIGRPSAVREIMDYLLK